MNRTVIAACLSVVLCSQILAQQPKVAGAPAAGDAEGESAPLPAATRQEQPKAKQPVNAQSAPPRPPSTAANAKKKRSAAKMKSTKPVAQPELPAPAPAAEAVPAPAAPLLPPTLMNQPPVHPTVTMRSGLLMIDAPNSTLSDVLNGVRQATGAVLEGVSPSDRVAVRLGPGSPRDVIAALLKGTPYDYLILGSDRNPDAVTRILLTQASSSPEAAPPQQPAVASQAPTPPPPDVFPDQDNAVPVVPEAEPTQPPPPPQQPVNPGQPWTVPQQPGQQPVAQ